MIAASSFRQYSRIARHFASTRAPEVLALQASPLLGCALGGFSAEPYSVLRFTILLLGSLALTAHIFIFNDWVGYSSDLHDPRRAEFVFTRQGISRGQVAVVTLALLGVANVAFVALGAIATLLGAAIAVLSVLYSCSALFGKRAPVVGSLNHLLGGALAAILVGPWLGAICVAVVLLVQCLLFADGGLSALGLNVVNMALVSALGGYAIFVALRAVLPRTRTALVAASGIAAGLGVVLASLAFTVEYALGGTGGASVATVARAMVGVHVLIGIGEGAITALVVSAVLASRPDLVNGAAGLPSTRPTADEPDALVAAP